MLDRLDILLKVKHFIFVYNIVKPNIVFIQAQLFQFIRKLKINHKVILD